jgi:hypothetical protein
MAHSTQQQILDLGQRWAAAERDEDVASLDALLHPEFVGVGPRGLVLTREQWLERYRSGDLRNPVFAWEGRAGARLRGHRPGRGRVGPAVHLQGPGRQRSLPRDAGGRAPGWALAHCRGAPERPLGRATRALSVDRTGPKGVQPFPRQPARHRPLVLRAPAGRSRQGRRASRSPSAGTRAAGTGEGGSGMGV